MDAFTKYRDPASSASEDEHEFLTPVLFDDTYHSEDLFVCPPPLPKMEETSAAAAPLQKNETTQLQAQAGAVVKGPGIPQPDPPQIPEEDIKICWPSPEPGEIPPGFTHPQKIKINSMGDVINPGDVAICVVPTIYHPSEFYLSIPKYWPDKLNAFAEKMTDWYTTLWYGPGRTEWVAAKQNISLGSIVAVWRDDELEWARGQIVKIMEKKYKVFLIDFGVYKRYGKHEVYYLLKKFANKLAFVVKCRAQLSSFYDKFHERHVDWNVDVKSTFFTALRGKNVHVRFMKRDPDSVWVVSLENFAEPYFRPDLKIPIQKAVVLRAMGKYVEEEIEEAPELPASQSGLDSADLK